MNEDYLEIESDIYHEIDRFNNIESTYRTNKRQDIIHAEYGQISTFAIIERFVKECIKAKTLPFDLEVYEHKGQRRKRLHRSTLVYFYPMLNGMLQAYDERFIYSPYVGAFFTICKQLEMLSDFRWLSDIYKKPMPGDMNYLNQFNKLAWSIKKHCEGKEFQEKLKAQARRVKDRKDAVLEWEHKLFKWHSRHLLVHLTLKYKEEYREELTPEIMQALWARLLRNKRMNKMLKGIKHYVWRIEAGNDKGGIHMHVVIAYNGRSHEDQNIAKYICTYFNEKLTNGKGDARADNFFKKSIARRGFGDGTGQINCYDMDKRKGLRTALQYLDKAGQVLQCKAHERVRTFGMSQIPEPSNLGRPRKDL
ncbi:Uncharacterised protein [Bordetella ansorpii]|uniref:Inovirus Gp2 family protein n=1 Tax=Bordetella ansorpii TaxID=288768 RepID=A0A157SRA5_9BORD|nr:inovirus-type Gp2 protein [Bordetella ansorpii]SAI72937.1 Uncharacterised protein [Bordetella ansorpii]